MGIKAVLLDGDGVLIDSFEFGVETHMIVAQTMGLRIPRREEFVKHWGLAWPEFLQALWPGVSLEAFDRVFGECGLKKKIIPAVAGANDVLSLLRKKGHFLALISNRDRESLIRRLAEAGIKLGLFHFTQALEDTPAPKPDPRIFKRVLLEISARGILKDGVIYVGDTITDFKATEHTQIEFVGVLTGPISRKVFVAAGVKKTNIIKSVNDLPEFLGIHQE